MADTDSKPYKFNSEDFVGIVQDNIRRGVFLGECLERLRSLGETIDWSFDGTDIRLFDRNNELIYSDRILNCVQFLDELIEHIEES